ncbi:hypothetical protein [Sphingorhabdus sp.]|uniref:hypothetical protein n=1 Tax=Sphingorhabdus sp. TaxID=1902408 RepID=UPI003919D187
MDELSLRDLELMARGKIAWETPLALMAATCADDILARVDPAIDHILQEFSRTPKERHDRSEDGLSIDLITSLKHFGFEATHDTTTGGHCDIVIDGRFDFLWLGEAKIHSGYDWLLKGFNQLDSRYATAIKDQDHGGIVIYHRGARADRVMDEWEKHLAESRPDVTIETREPGDLVMNTRHVHERTGREYKVRHVIVSLYWNPKN